MLVASPRNTICETLREIYWMANETEGQHREEMMLKCRIATAMAKAMSRKLEESKGHDWYVKEKFWDDKP